MNHPLAWQLLAQSPPEEQADEDEILAVQAIIIRG